MNRIDRYGLLHTDAEKRAATAKKGAPSKPKVVKAANNNKAGGKLAPKKVLTVKPTKTVQVKPNNRNNNNNNKNVIKKVNTTPKTTPRNAPKNNQKPAAQKPKQTKPTTPTGAAAPPKGKLESALETARAVARNKNHFNHNEIKSLLESFEKGWTSKEKFVQLLPGLLGLK